MRELFTKIDSTLMKRLLALIFTLSIFFSASKGDEDIDSCLSNPELDLVLMDIRMLEMDGNEATRQICLFNTDVIIIAQTANAFAVDIEKAMKAGCKVYISNPIQQGLLMEVIQNILVNRK